MFVKSWDGFVMQIYTTIKSDTLKGQNGTFFSKSLLYMNIYIRYTLKHTLLTEH